MKILSKKTILFLVFLMLISPAFAVRILLPMDEEQKNHLKAYGLSYWVLKKGP
jgi:hypothetical protein